MSDSDLRQTSRDTGITVEEFQRARAELMDEARSEAVAKQHDRGKMTARERIDLLLDADSAVEYGSFVQPDRVKRLEGIPLPADGLVTCTGTIDGRPVSAVAYDFTVMGGSNGLAGAAKFIRMAQLSLEQGFPHIILLDGGGHRMQEMDSREFATGGPSSFREQALMSGWTPQVCAVMGPALAGPAAQAMFADFVPMVRGTGLIGMAGKALVQAGTGLKLTTQDLFGSEVQARNGLVDMELDDDKACLDAVKEYLSFMPTNASEAPPVRRTDDPGERLCPELRDALPDRRQPYDMRTILRPVVDDGHLFELRPTFARNVITALARIDGRPVGIVASQPAWLAGAMDRDACIKATHLVSMCDAFGLPILTFVDSPGSLIGPEAEKQALARYATNLLVTLGHATVPIINVAIRKCYGLAWVSMAGGRAYNAVASLIWPSAEVCPMNVEGAVEQAYGRQIAAAEDPAALRTELVEELYEQSTPFRAASGFGIDEIIDPAETRRQIARVLKVNTHRRPVAMPPKRHRIAPI